MFIMIDGIDGSGKSTVIQAWKEYLVSQGNAIFDLKKYWEKYKHYPELSELKSYDFIFSCEPTYADIGRAIRQELINKTKKYPADAIAQAYSLDRLILYNKIIIPLLKEKKYIIQDRGVSSSLAYQPLQDKKISLRYLCALPGNHLALKHNPKYLVILDVDPKNAAQRLSKRTGKKDKAIFEKINFQKRLAERFKAKKFQEIFLRIKTKIHYLPANDKIAIMKNDAIQLFKKITT